MGDELALHMYGTYDMITDVPCLGDTYELGAGVIQEWASISRWLRIMV